MLIDRRRRLEQRLNTFEKNIARARAFAHLKAKPSPIFEDENGSAIADTTLFEDFGYFSIVAVVASIDEFIKALSFEICHGYLLGDVKQLRRIRVHISLATARSFVDVREKDIAGNLVDQAASLAVASLMKDFERENFQGWNSISARFRDLGLGSLSGLIEESYGREVCEDFKRQIDALASARHMIVHRLGMVDQFIDVSSLNDLNSMPATVTDHQFNIIEKVCNKIIEVACTKVV